MGGDPGRPDDYAPPSYVYRWGSTGASHCSGLMRAPDDETWYERHAGKHSAVGRLRVELDGDVRPTVRYCDELSSDGTMQSWEELHVL